MKYRIHKLTDNRQIDTCMDNSTA